MLFGIPSLFASADDTMRNGFLASQRLHLILIMPIGLSNRRYYLSFFALLAGCYCIYRKPSLCQLGKEKVDICLRLHTLPIFVDLPARALASHVPAGEMAG